MKKPYHKQQSWHCIYQFRISGEINGLLIIPCCLCVSMLSGCKQNEAVNQKLKGVYRTDEACILSLEDAAIDSPDLVIFDDYHLEVHIGNTQDSYSWSEYPTATTLDLSLIEIKNDTNTMIIDCTGGDIYFPISSETNKKTAICKFKKIQEDTEVDYSS